ncbi:F0F1 ATP synthase subunit A [Halobacteriovorax sp. GFR7]|uniref:F0F1 ATP synthase subunit A n=1 Tax=unclassified Halobacteriovorax TaxID=2639665 RepID=UPI003D9771A4
MNSNKLFESIVFYVATIPVSNSVVISWIIIGMLLVLSLITSWHLKNVPSNYQSFIEIVATSIRDMIEDMIPGKADMIFSFITTLWIFIFFSNLIGLIPGFSSPTSDLSTTTALAFVVFFSVHWFGIKSIGLKRYLKHYATPSPILIPIHLISEFSRTIALAIRLFGNVMSLEIAAALVLMVAGFLVPVPILLLHIVEAVIQTYLFGMLSLIYIAGGIQSQEIQLKKQEDNKGNTYE